jgi:hypothetical protein
MASKTSSRPRQQLLRAFLSHRYRSPAVNLRFFDIFSQAAQVQFSVDLGELATNVTRLERLVRDADAFIGVYPLSLPAQSEVTPEELRKQSRYYRLELDLALRAGIPTIVFADQRYGRVLECPAWARKYTFDAQEVESPAGGPGLRVFAKAFKDFASDALAYQTYRVNQAVAQRGRSRIGLLLPPATYPAVLRERIARLMMSHEREVLDLGWPPQLGGGFFSGVGDLDWIVLDVCDDPDNAAAVGFLHGQFVPAIRLVNAAADTPPGALRRGLYGGVEVGYAKDIVAWSDADELLRALEGRLATILRDQRLIGDAASAREYFASASLRQEIVFVSYAGADAEAARPVIDALKRQFKTVFDYKDGASIRPGRPWLEEIFGTIGRASGAVTLLSPRYLASENCLHEARQIVARRDERKLALLPLRLTEEAIDTPEWLKDPQHARLAQLAGPDEVPRLLVPLLAPPAA